VLALVGGHLWFVHNARSILKQIVAEKSHGKLKIELSQFSFDLFSNKLQIKQADLISTDSVTQAVTYHVTFRKLTLRVHSFWPLLFERKLLLDSIKLHDPEIEVMQWRRDTVAKTGKDEMSVPQEMGKLYNSMLDALQTFGVRRIIINNATLRLVNKMDPAAQPVVISHIFFDLWHTGETGKKRDAYIANEQNVVLHIDRQSINLPGGRHQLSFKTFNLELFNKRVEMDSCTITARATDSSKTNYKIFFDKLLLIGMDFDAMYRYNIIRADSVYCAKPFFDLNFEPPRKTAVATPKKERPDFEKLVHDLTGDLDLAFVGVTDAGIRININGDRQRSLFNSSKDNFEMRGLRINADSSQPVVVDRFDMLVRDYHLYNADSSSAYTFDSIHFLNNKVVLNNFSVTTASDRFRQRDERDFHIPYFELTGLDWYELVFDQSLDAEEAVMYNPVIHFKKNPRSIAARKTSFFGALQSIDSIMTLNKIKIINGQLDAQLGHATSVSLENLNLSLFSNSLMHSKNQEGIRRAVEYLSFSKGSLHFKDITAQLKNIRFTGNNLLHCDQLLVTSTKQRVHADVRDVFIDNMLIDEKAETILLDGLRWNRASLDWHGSGNPPPASSGGGAQVRIKNIIGRNTRLAITNGPLSVSSFVNELRVASLARNGRAPMRIDGLQLSGRDLAIGKEGLSVKAATYHVNSGAQSQISNVLINQIRGRDSVKVQSPQVNFTADVNELINHNLHVREVNMASPLISLHKWNDPTESKPSKGAIQVDKIVLSEPVVDIALHRHDSVTLIRVPEGANASMSIAGLKLDDGVLDMGRFTLASNAVTLVKSTGQTVGVEKGKVNLSINDIHLGQKNGKPGWSLAVDQLYLQNPNSLMLGKPGNKLTLKEATIGNFRLSSETFANATQLLRSNVAASLHAATGEYVDSNTTLKWFNAEYNADRKVFRIDSFIYHPTQSLDTVLARAAYQTDYITFHSGPVQLSGFDLSRYERDSALLVNTVDIQSPLITIFRDKQPPFQSGVIKQLPVGMIRQVPFPLQLLRVNLVDGTLSYTEKNAHTRAEGTLVLKRLNGVLGNIRNQNIKPNDSLLFALNAYLMDSAFLDLRVKQSYSDTLSGFLMTLRMRPTSLSFLNPVLAPLSNVKITSGTIDSFRLRAVGRDDLAYGEMNMFYHNLRIKIVKDGDENKSSFLGNIASALVNTFFVRKNNNGRTGIIYYPRLRDRSFFNYIVKMTFSGIATSVGVKKNSKSIKRYRRSLKSNQLPEVDL
jgi:hypothetical protein